MGLIADSLTLYSLVDCSCFLGQNVYALQRREVPQTGTNLLLRMRADEASSEVTDEMSRLHQLLQEGQEAVWPPQSFSYPSRLQ